MRKDTFSVVPAISSVVPAKAGTQVFVAKIKTWTPAFAGATQGALA
jgi:hypothetical protein